MVWSVVAAWQRRRRIERYSPPLPAATEIERRAKNRNRCNLEQLIVISWVLFMDMYDIHEKTGGDGTE